MSLLLLTSAGHSPGVTALAVALSTLQPSLLVDANREPDQSVLAGYLQGVDPAGRGLAGLLSSHRERRPMAEALEAQLIPLAGGSDFLPGFSHPGMVSHFGPVWPSLARLLAACGRPLLVDLGRISPGGLPEPLVELSSGVAVLTGSRLVDLAALRLYLPYVLDAAGKDRVGLVVVGPGRPYGSGEIAHQFGVASWGKLSWSPAEAAVFASGETPPRRLSTSPYLADVRTLAAEIASRCAGRRRLLNN